MVHIARCEQVQRHNLQICRKENIRCIWIESEESLKPHRINQKECRG